ncbi:LysR family transcriptional regulator [Mycolicibacterium smegmatis]|uniref:LysR family transcriptional regulator n=1 Tax=Mycolicibacterium smegmatis TaxID=1772 RepID=UPI0005D82693|nr:LysR family transcriptional regulator [Mycolicibacterium smegmatis]MDF1901345.1 LysR family transcriptional regulator [Mycolicibacterium smegmatis]MDF1907608.1 LysR family transcriptional regulator [Mycolicibacterium smegmatis]MDF1920392.1 LysR family transcriptional regulator [Mycolicibacterium smegmatis]MDF1926146.1 LysR family transcriptional regulator [Mycolicibacterium smegmatis]UAK54040.1 LysR family transcriptional regulator [Mycolicibacterium smegmatis]
MELRHLRYFAAVADTCHFGQAAEQLHVAQPALSYAIRQLETELDVTLFYRTTRQVSLTPAGEFLRAEAARILAGVDDAERGVRRIARGRGGLLRLGLTGTAAFSHLPRIARIVKRELPDVALEIHADMLTPVQCDSLRSGALDLGVLRPPAVGDGVELTVIDAESLVLAVSADHRLAAEPVVSMADLRAEPFVGYASRDSAVNDAVLRSCRSAGFVPDRAHTAPGTAVLLALVAADLGVAVVPESVRALPLDGVVFRDLLDGGTVELALAWRRAADRDSHANPLVGSVVDILAPALSRESVPSLEERL